ncbi:porin, partial [Klebsiella pneumoniae]|uniref:porin n=1 Tax=Klebsiella pneumoniae TaxID=573 RepID=UPI0006C23F5F
MKLRVLSLMVPALLIAGTAGAAEIYNKDGNKLDLYGKADGLHYFSSNNGVDGDQSYMRFGLRGETQISDQLTEYGQWEYQANLNHAEDRDGKSFTRSVIAGLRFGDYSSFDYSGDFSLLYYCATYTNLQPECDGGKDG